MSQTSFSTPFTKELASRASSFLESHQSCDRPNVSQNERLLSLAGGAALAGYGLARGRFSGLVTLLGAAALIYRGWTGHCSAYEKLGINHAEGKSCSR